MGIGDIRTNVGDALYPRTRQAVLRFFFTRPDRRFIQSEVIRAIGLGSGTVQRELERLSNAEILVRTVEGRQIYFQANPESPVFEELRGLVRKTFGLTYVLQEALAALANRIDLAFVFGSVASGSEKSSSDVDLMVVSDSVSLSDLVPALRDAEQTLGREVNPSLYTKKNLKEKLAAGHHFLANVAEAPKLFLIGDEHEFGRLAEVRLAQNAQDQSKRDRGSAGHRGS